jgi:hypothetical protein
MEKLPQRNLLLPNAPITPFSTSKKNKHPFKTLLSTSGMNLFLLKYMLFKFIFFMMKKFSDLNIPYFLFIFLHEIF